MINRAIHHIGFTVPDLEAAVEQWVSVYGAGPFLVLEDIEFDVQHSRGGSARLLHTAAFGQCGEIPVELQQIKHIEPDRLWEPMTAGLGAVMNHVAYVVDDPAAESGRLEALGMPEFFHARLGDVQVTWHDARAQLGHAIELHIGSDFLTRFFETVRAASQDWDGSERLRAAA